MGGRSSLRLSAAERAAVPTFFTCRHGFPHSQRLARGVLAWQAYSALLCWRQGLGRLQRRVFQRRVFQRRAFQRSPFQGRLQCLELRLENLEFRMESLEDSLENLEGRLKRA